MDTPESNANGRRPLPKMMIAFVVRRCTVELGHAPSPAEFATWANRYGDEAEPACLFGRPISEREAHIILKHQARLVSAKSATPDEEYVSAEELPARIGGNVFSLSAARDEKRARGRRLKGSSRKTS